MPECSEIKEPFVRRKTRVSGSYSPGFYCKIKITPTILPLKRKKYNTPGLAHFKNDLQCIILKNLNSRGACLRSGRFTISKNIEKFLKNKYAISKRWQNSQVVLEDLGMTIKIYKSNYASTVTNFNLKFGNRRFQKVQVEVSFLLFLFTILVSRNILIRTFGDILRSSNMV